MRKPDFFRLLGIGAFTTSLALTDHYVKEKIEDGSINNGVIKRTKGFAEIEKHHNKGLPMNKLDNHTKEIAIASSFVTIYQALATLTDALNDSDGVKDTANAMILAGALSNTYDRLERGYVVDYLKLGKKKAIFNISDFLIIFGVIIRLIKSLFD